MKKHILTKVVAMTLALGLGGACAWAGSYISDFNTDPTTGATPAALRGNAVWRATGSSDGSGYVSLCDAVNSQQGTILLPDLDPGSPVYAFKLKARIRIGGGTGRPADGVSFNYAADPGNTSEEGTADGLTVSFDTWDNGGGDGPALDIKVAGATIAHKRFAGQREANSPNSCVPVEVDGLGAQISLETDPSGTAAPGTWVDVEIDWDASGAMSVSYKGTQFYNGVVTGFAPVTGSLFSIGARTGNANDNEWIDDLSVDTVAGDAPPRLTKTSSVVSPGHDVSEFTPISFTIDASTSFFDVDTTQLILDGSDVTADPNTVISFDVGTRITTVVYTPSPAWAPNSHHKATLNYTDNNTPPSACSGGEEFYVTPVVAATDAGTTVFIEAEDFNYSDVDGAGKFFDFGAPAGSYNALAALHDTDYHEASSNPDSPLYRVLVPPNGISNPGTPDLNRAGTDIAIDYKVGWNDAGDWYNYTRTFANTTYKIYGRFASGGSDTSVGLSKVTSDPTLPGQTTAPMGTFTHEFTGGWDTFCFSPLRDSSGNDVVVRLNGLTTVRITTLGGNDDFNYLAFVPTPSDTLRPTVLTQLPIPGSESPRDPLIKVVIADADTAVDPSSIRLILNGVELLPVVQTPIAGGAEGSFQVTTPLVTGTLMTAKVIYKDNDATPVELSSTWTFTVGVFKGGDKTLFIEAEDFNYSDDGVTGGLHANFGDPDCSLANKNAVINIDYNANGNNGQTYRSATQSSAGKQNASDTLQRGDHFITCNWIVGWNDPGEWYNYTRDFGASRRYNFYARMTDGDTAAGATMHTSLGTVTSDPASPGQTTDTFGDFLAPTTGAWDNAFITVPLKDSNGKLVSKRLEGLNTLRFSILPGGVDFNYIAAVEADVQTVTPDIASVEPRADSAYARAPLVTANIKNEDSNVDPTSITLKFDGTDVTGSSTITPTADGATITYQAPTGTPVGGTHTVRVGWSDDQPTPFADSFTWTYTEGIYNQDSNLFIEAEDFNTDSGGYIPTTGGHPFNEKSLYDTLGATPDIDYHDSGDGQESNLYRTEGIANIPHVNMIGEIDDHRGGAGPRDGFIVTDYKIGWTDSAGGGGGDWYNYTRNFGDGGVYTVHARLAHGDAAATMGGRLEKVDDVTTPVQSTSLLGHFRAPATGGWDTFTFVPLKTADGNTACVALAGVQNLRFTVEAGGGDFEYLMFCPVARPTLSVTRAGNVLTVTWPYGNLEIATDVTGPWANSGASSPLVIPIDPGQPQIFARVACP